MVQLNQKSDQTHPKVISLKSGTGILNILLNGFNRGPMWVVVKIMVPFWIPSIIRHLIFRVRGLPRAEHPNPKP